MLVSSNMEESHWSHLASNLGVQLVRKHNKYLGLPEVAGRSRSEMLQSIQDSVWRKVEGWNSKLLSQADKGVLIKAILQSIPTYVMSCFKVPNCLVHAIESMSADFWWHSIGVKKVHWVAWQKLSQPIDNEELRFQDLKVFNKAVLTKQGWHLLTRSDILVNHIFLAKYHLNSTLMEAELGSRRSLTWSSILAALDLLVSGYRWQIGLGDSGTFGKIVG